MMAGTLAGCSHEIQETTGDPFSEGKYPLQLSAEVNGMHPGSDGKEYWSGDGTEFVGIRMGDNQKVARYLVGSDKASSLVCDSRRPVVREYYPALYETGLFQNFLHDEIV